MPWLSILGLIGKPIMKLIENRSNRKFLLDKLQKVTDNKVEVSDSEIRLMQSQMTGASWKDEWFSILISLPVLAMFFSPWIPSLEQASQNAVALIGEDVYPYLLGACISASFGIRAYRK